MKIKKSGLLLLSVLMLSLLVGCQLAVEGSDVSVAEDHLVGVYITTEPLDLFDMDAYLGDNLRVADGEIRLDGDADAYAGRLYATVEKTEKGPAQYVFEGVEGSGFFALEQEDEQGICQHTAVSGAISDARAGFTTRDDGEQIDLTASVYFESGGSGACFYLNPVYQSADGAVYLMAGSGISTGGVASEGMMMGQTWEETYIEEKNGKTEQNGIAVKIDIVGVVLPEKYVILAMSEADEILSRPEYASGSFPEELVFEPEVAYVILKGVRTDLETTVDVYDRTDEFLTTMERYSAGVCIRKDIPLCWN